MSEETDGQDTGAEAVAGGVDPAAVALALGAEAGAIFTGPESDLDGLMQKAAEHVYSITQPFRYAISLLDLEW